MMVTGGMTSASVMSASTSLISSLNECGNVVFPAVFSWYLSLPLDLVRSHITHTITNITNEIRIPLTLPPKYMYIFSLFPAGKRKQKQTKIGIKSSYSAIEGYARKWCVTGKRGIWNTI